MRGEMKRLLMQTTLAGDTGKGRGEPGKRFEWLSHMDVFHSRPFHVVFLVGPASRLTPLSHETIPALLPEGGCIVSTELNWQRWSFCPKHCVLWWQEEHWAWREIIPTPTPAPSLTFYITSSPSSITLSSDGPSLKWKWLAISRRVVSKIKSNAIRSD